MEYILVVFIYAGVFAKGDSVAVQSIPGWTSQSKCEAAGRSMEPLVKGTAKDIKFVCVQK